MTEKGRLGMTMLVWLVPSFCQRMTEHIRGGQKERKESAMRWRRVQIPKTTTLDPSITNVEDDRGGNIEDDRGGNIEDDRGGNVEDDRGGKRRG